MTDVNTELEDGHFCKGEKLIPTIQFRKKLTNEMMDNTIGVDTVDYGIPSRSTYTPAIVPYKFQKVKNHEGIYNKKAKNPKTSSKNIKNSNAPTLKLATNGPEVFVNPPWASFCEMYV